MVKLLFRIRFLIYSIVILVLFSTMLLAQKETTDAAPTFLTYVAKPLQTFGDVVLGMHTRNQQHIMQLSGWIPEWAYDHGVDSFIEHGNTFTQINPVWYHLDEGSTLKPTAYAGSSKLQKLAGRLGVKFVPTIQSFDADILHEVLKSKASTLSHASEILAIVDKYYLDGIDLDYEMIYVDDTNNFYLLLQTLSQDLHRKDKKLVIDVFSKTTDDKEAYETMSETRQVQDWTILAKYVDEIRIMAYDYANSTPGGSPINPYPWLEKIAQYAVTKTDPQKIILGTPLYSYAWEKDGELLGSFTYKTIKKSITRRAAKPLFDTEVKEWKVELIDTDLKNNSAQVAGAYTAKISTPSAQFSDDEQSKPLTQTVWYQDVKSFEYRFNLVKQYNLGGLALWRLGEEDERIYKLFE